MHSRFLSCSKHSGKCSLFWFHESEKWNWKLLSHACPDSLWPHGIVRGLLQARILEWVAVSFSRGSSQPRDPELQGDSLNQLSHHGSPRILEWVAYPFGSSWPRNRTGVSYIAGRFFISWATKESFIYFLSLFIHLHRTRHTDRVCEFP